MFIYIIYMIACWIFETIHDKTLRNHNNANIPVLATNTPTLLCFFFALYLAVFFSSTLYISIMMLLIQMSARGKISFIKKLCYRRSIMEILINEERKKRWMYGYMDPFLIIYLPVSLKNGMQFHFMFIFKVI